MSAGSDGNERTRSVELFVEGPTSVPRRREPVTCGLPWPRGAIPDPAHLRLEDETGRPVLLQTRVLDRWSDGTARWLLLDWLADIDSNARYRVRTGTISATLPQV